MAGVTWWVLGEHARKREPDEIRLRLPSTGLVPLELAATVLMLPATLWSLDLDVGPLVNLIIPGTQRYFLCQVLLIVAGSLLLSHWFNHPRRHALVLEQLGGAMDRPALERALAALGRAAAVRSAGYVAAVALASLVGTRIVSGLLGHTVMVQRGAGLGTEVLRGVVVTAAIMDFAGEWRARRAHGALAAAWPEHRVYAIDPTLQMLAAAKIPSHARGAHMRALLQFFGPWVPVEILVPEAQAAEARALIESRLLPGDAEARVGAEAAAGDDGDAR